MTAYTLALLLTIVIMHTFQAAQPALLYLSPALSLSAIACAVVRSEWSSFWSFDEAAEQEQENKLAEEKRYAEEKRDGSAVAQEDSMLPAAPRKPFRMDKGTLDLAWDGEAADREGTDGMLTDDEASSAAEPEQEEGSVASRLRRRRQ